MLEIPRGRNWSVVHTILNSEDESDFADMWDAAANPPGFTPVRCQLRGKTAIKNPANGMFELPLVAEVTAGLSGLTGEILTLSLFANVTDTIPVGDYILDAFAIWTDYEEQILVPEVVRVVNFPTRSIGSPEFPPNFEQVVPSFVDDFTTALVD